jgi:branched-chain amino acid transport system ATP-binding protein
MSDFFSIQNLYVNYGEAQALFDVNIGIEQGQMVTIIGTNGAGKTTLVNTIAGILRPRSGHIWLEGQDVSTVAPHTVSDYGIAIVPEGRRLFTKLSVLENLQMGAYPTHARNNEQQSLDYVYSLFPRLAERRQQLAGTLSGGEQQMVAIGRALMAKPRLLLLDEPSLGLAPIIVEIIFAAIERAKAESGTTILLVEQNANLALQVVDYAYIISEGKIVREGNAKELAADDSIKQAYLGLKSPNISPI